ncbi:predicted protein [Botrytis cinerea T4]|uniref:Uncharacterized protein n=1 Tax=Botryotinia fuckeliana (strain T4) TaxID=999810 RepID=G2YAJ3_BOTF4|nr:predicted protein [Botrytis cinerea T4]
MVVMEFECQDLLNPDVVPVDEIPEFRFVFDGKWKKPDDLIICPRLRSRGFYPLMVYYQFDGERKCENEDETLLQGLAFLGVIIGTKYGECFVVIARLLWIAEKEDAGDAVGPVFVCSFCMIVACSSRSKRHKLGMPNLWITISLLRCS